MTWLRRFPGDGQASSYLGPLQPRDRWQKVPLRDLEYGIAQKQTLSMAVEPSVSCSVPSAMSLALSFISLPRLRLELSLLGEDFTDIPFSPLPVVRAESAPHLPSSLHSLFLLPRRPLLLTPRSGVPRSAQ